MKPINQIFPSELDRNGILFNLGSAITGKATKEQKILYLMGNCNENYRSNFY
jgi:hypothetical protein